MAAASSRAVRCSTKLPMIGCGAALQAGDGRSAHETLANACMGWMGKRSTGRHKSRQCGREAGPRKSARVPLSEADAMLA